MYGKNGKYTVRIKVDGRLNSYGIFHNEKDAGRHYNKII